MKPARRFLVGTTALVLSASAAMAADPIFIPPTAPYAGIPPAPAFSFAGGYIGVFGGIAFFLPPPPFFGTVGTQIGYNFAPGSFLFGVEGQAALAVTSGSPLSGAFDLHARAGFIIGDRVLLYGKAGVGLVVGGGNPLQPFYSAGGGVELGIGERTTFGVEVDFLGAFGGGGFINGRITAGLNILL